MKTNMNIYMAFTWLLANLLQPLITYLYYNEGELSSYFVIFVYSLVISLPSLFLSQLAGYLITRIQSSLTIQFFVWLIVAPLIVILNFMMLFLVGGNDAFSQFELRVAMPAIISVLLVVLLRYQSFFKACMPVTKEDTEQQDQTL